LVAELEACFVVIDSAGQKLGRRSAAELLTKDEARRIAANIAKLPELLHISPKRYAHIRLPTLENLMLELPRPTRPGFVASVVDALKYIIKMPYRTHRRTGIALRLPPLPDGRGWRTAISPALHISIIRGMMDYDYRDVPMQKHPMDMALYMRLIWQLKPRTIIEIGSLAGGSAAWLGTR
jgi:hypothetical protein